MINLLHPAIFILEVSSSFYPEKTPIFSPEQSFTLPYEQTWVSFSGNQKILCGPSPFINTMNCFSTKLKSYVKSVPIPGSLSTTPLFIHNSWVIGTTKGFLVRIEADEKTSLPHVDPQSTEFWGSYSRKMMENFVPKTIYKEESVKGSASKENSSSNQNSAEKLKNYLWVFPTSSPFVGKPLFHENILYGITANQSLQAIDFETGQLIWSVKLARDVSFYLENQTLSIKNNTLYAGSAQGDLMLLNLKTGQVIKQIQMTPATKIEYQRFPNIVSAPLLLSDDMAIVSNATSVTKKISLESKEALWSYPDGSVITALLLDKKSVILSTVRGKIVSLNEQTGSTNWTSHLDLHSPIVDMTLLDDKKTLLAATQRGELIAIDANSGSLLAHNRPIGAVVGKFFTLESHPGQYCLSFSTASFRCFRVKR